MSGETADRASGWTVDTLHAHFTELLREKDLRDEQRFSGQQVALRDALDRAEKAVEKANTATEKRFDSVNEFRGQLADQAATFMPRQEAQVMMASLKEQIDRNRTLSDERFGQVLGDSRFMSGRSVGTDKMIAYVFAAGGAVVGLLGLIVAFTR